MPLHPLHCLVFWVAVSVLTDYQGRQAVLGWHIWTSILLLSAVRVDGYTTPQLSGGIAVTVRVIIITYLQRCSKIIKIAELVTKGDCWRFICLFNWRELTNANFKINSTIKALTHRLFGLLCRCPSPRNPPEQPISVSHRHLCAVETIA